MNESTRSDPELSTAAPANGVRHKGRSSSPAPSGGNGFAPDSQQRPAFDIRALERERGIFYSTEPPKPHHAREPWREEWERVHPQSRWPEAFHALTGRVWGSMTPCPICREEGTEAWVCSPEAGVGVSCGRCGVKSGPAVLAALLGITREEADQMALHWMNTGEVLKRPSAAAQDVRRGSSSNPGRSGGSGSAPGRTYDDAARGRWPELLEQLGGVDPALLDGKPHGCPVCREGEDRFTFDDRDGAGTWICRKCPPRPGRAAAAGRGIDLLMGVTGWDFKRAAQEVERHLGLLSSSRSGAHHQRRQQQAPAITLAAHPGPLPEPPPDHLPAGHRIPYSPTQWTEWEDGSRTGRDGRIKTKGERPRHSDASGRIQYRAGSDPWPLFGAELLPHAAGQWVAAAEGPKCAGWLQAGGLVAVSQPGHDHKAANLVRRFRDLQAAGVAGMVYLADHDDAGRRKARQLATAAAQADFPLRVLGAADVWPTIQDKGSIDDAPGTAAERVSALLAAVAAGKAQALEPEARPAPPQPPTDATGIDAVLGAIGSGWVPRSDGPPRRSTLAIGDLSGRLSHRLGDRLGFDELALMPAVDGKTLAGHEIDFLHARLSENGWRIGKGDAIDGLMRAAHQHPFHPVRRYLEGIEADPSITPIDLSSFGADYYGVSDPLHARFLRIMLLGAAWRAMDPGCDFKTCVVLQSERQTIFKSRSLEALAGPDWFCDSGQESEKDLFLAIHTCWLYELAEIETQTGKKAAGKLKNQLSSKRDTFRPPYARAMEKMPRASIFVGTCNRDDFLVDETGNTRFLIVPLTQRIDYRKIERDRDRIWKAAMAAYRAGERPWLSEAELAASESQNRNYTAEHEWTEPVTDWLRGRGHDHGFTIKDALIHSGIRPSLDRIEPGRDANRMGAVLRALGCKRSANAVRREGERVRLWFPPALAQPAHPGTPSAQGGVPPQEGSVGNASQPPGTPGTPFFKDSDKRGEEESYDAVTQLFTPSGGVSEKGGAGVPPASATAQTDCGGSDHSRHTPWHRGVPEPGRVPPTGEELPPWFPRLRQLMAEHPEAVAAQLAQWLDPKRTGRPTGREVKPWADRIRGEQQQEEAA